MGSMRRSRICSMMDNSKGSLMMSIMSRMLNSSTRSFGSMMSSMME